LQQIIDAAQAIAQELVKADLLTQKLAVKEARLMLKAAKHDHAE
jgi:hypothetical protein